MSTSPNNSLNSSAVLNQSSGGRPPSYASPIGRSGSGITGTPPPAVPALSLSKSGTTPSTSPIPRALLRTPIRGGKTESDDDELDICTPLSTPQQTPRQEARSVGHTVVNSLDSTQGDVEMLPQAIINSSFNQQNSSITVAVTSSRPQQCGSSSSAMMAVCPLPPPAIDLPPDQAHSRCATNDPLVGEEWREPSTLHPSAVSGPPAVSSVDAQQQYEQPSGDEPSQNIQRPDGTTIDEKTLRNSRMVLGLLVVLKILTSYDGGAFSVVLGADEGLAAELGLTTSEAGTLSSSVFLGNLVGCIIAGGMFSKHSAKLVMFLGMFAHALFTFIFGLSTSFEFALIVRFLLGLTLAFPVVYSPIWVEDFAPQDRATTWMALCNAGVPIGTMLGFVIGGLIPSNTSVDWRWVFFGKAIGMLPILLLMHQLDKKYIDAEGATSGANFSSADGSFRGAVVNVLTLLKKFARSPLYLNCVAALCTLYFVITALQTFITPYLRAPPFNASMSTIVLGFGGTVVTAPVFGVIGGGIIIDRIGGYHRNLRLAMILQLSWGCAAAVCSVLASVMTNVMGFLLVMWVLLAIGAAIVPVAMGVMVAAIEDEHRSAASSVAAMCFNLFGYFSGPLFCGIMSDLTESLAWGIRITLLVSFLGCVPMARAALYARTAKLPPPSAPRSPKTAASGD